MSKEFEGDLVASMGFSAGNWFWGEAIITPNPGEYSSVDVTGITIDGEGEIFYQTSVTTQYPWHTVGQATISPASETGFFDEPYNENAFRIWIRRNNDTPQPVSWMVWRELE